ncbi:hypothetical protein [Microcoleus sp. MON2_D5]|uniref:hypothetical protein n=1 Tax=Microcoleus sp. MON2_D5 TaxID=2818833 RepID=UPI002FD277A9
MKKHEINLNFTETDDDSISETCKCEFCDHPIRFYRYKGWLDDDYLVQNADGSHHYPCNRPTSWSEFGSKGIPDGWEYWKSDDDDDRACFIQKKYTRFERSYK